MTKTADTVKAIRINRTGGPEVLEYVDVEVGEPGPGEARVRQHAVVEQARDAILLAVHGQRDEAVAAHGQGAADDADQDGGGIAGAVFETEGLLVDRARHNRHAIGTGKDDRCGDGGAQVALGVGRQYGEQAREQNGRFQCLSG